MKSYQYAAVAALAASASAQSWPSCANSCISGDINSGTSYTALCKDSSKVSTVTSCLTSSGCSDSDKNSVFSYIAQMCKNAGAAITSGPLATYTSSVGTFPTGASGGFGGFGLDASDSSAFASYTSAHPNGPSSGDWSSFTAAHSITGGPWGSGTPTGSWSTQFTGGPGGFGGFGSGAGGWGGGAGPFGAGGQGGWGQGPWASGASFTAGPWTSWWNENSCPKSDWPGWTSGTWSTSAPWTSWTGCSASVTATSVFTTTSNGVTYTTTGFGYQLAQVSGSGSSASPTRTNNANGLTIAGGAAAAALMGVIAML